MAYRLFDKGGSEVTHHNLQDKGPWCVTGATFEETFISKYGPALNLVINPEKAFNKYAPDLLNVTTQNIADLKTQNTPFFQAAARYGLDPQYAVTFNTKDYDRYLSLYPKIEIYFWVDWLAIKFQSFQIIEVSPMSGIWKIPFAGIIELAKTSPIHSYQQRTNDMQGNAKGSYVFDLSASGFEQVAYPI